MPGSAGDALFVCTIVEGEPLTDDGIPDGWSNVASSEEIHFPNRRRMQAWAKTHEGETTATFTDTENVDSTMTGFMVATNYVDDRDYSFERGDWFTPDWSNLHSPASGFYPLEIQLSPAVGSPPFWLLFIQPEGAVTGITADAQAAAVDIDLVQVAVLPNPPDGQFEFWTINTSPGLGFDPALPMSLVVTSDEDQNFAYIAIGLYHRASRWWAGVGGWA